MVSLVFSLKVTLLQMFIWLKSVASFFKLKMTLFKNHERLLEHRSNSSQVNS